jgi:small subunit ribosomal protein S21
MSVRFTIEARRNEAGESAACTNQKRWRRRKSNQARKCRKSAVDYSAGRSYARGSNFAATRRIMEIRVEGSLDQAMRALKRKLAKEGVFKEMKKRAFYEKPSVRRKRKRSEAQRRRRKEQRRRRASAM